MQLTSRGLLSKLPPHKLPPKQLANLSSLSFTEEPIMRMLLLLGAIVIGLAAAGIIHFQKNGDQLDISIDKQRFERAAAKAIDEGKTIISDVEASIENSRSEETKKSIFPLSTRR